MKYEKSGANTKHQVPMEKDTKPAEKQPSPNAPDPNQSN